MRKFPPHSPFHWLFAVLLMISIAGALWQHGHAGLTIGLLAAVPVFAASVYLPYRWVPALVRSIANCVLFGCALGWAVWRMKANFPDLVMIEGLCIASLIFMAGGKHRDYFYLFFISIFLLIYGSLVPRMTHLYLSAAAMVVLLVIGLFFRSDTLAGKPPVREIRSRPARRWHHAVIQLILSGFFFWYIFALMPLKNNDVPGLFETSFLTTRETMLPMELGKWLRPKKIQIRPDAKMVYTRPSESKPTEKGEQGTPADIPDQTSKSIIDGGGSSQGEDLVFYTKSDVKLYHLARLYDSYDGVQWKATPRLEKVRIRDYGTKANVRSHFAEQKYTLVKFISKRLYSGFRPVNFSPDDAIASFTKNVRASFYGAEMQNLPSEPPLKYVTSVQILMPLKPPEISSGEPETPPPPPPPPPKKGKAKKRRPPKKVKLPPDPDWVETISKQNYLQLPRKKISPRVRDLAARIAKNNLTPYGKALALRDYLRQNYTYKLQAEPVPPGKEPADYFLFELKEGHCEYFACALAVLARSAGLPARVATGFSPGNFNTLSNMFEIYEYHAHAWTQIYVQPIGWLTMDATPPSEIVSRTLPAGIGSLRDPFDDEWRITPPELTEKTQEFLKQDLLKRLEKKDELSKIDSTLVEMVKAQEKIQEKVKEKYDGTVKQLKKSSESGRIYQLKQFWRKFTALFGRTFTSVYDFLFSTWILLLPGVLLLIVGYKFIGMCHFNWRRKNKYTRIGQLRKEAEELAASDPRQSVLDIYTALRFSLELAGYDRGTMELLDFSESLAETGRSLSEGARVIFILYYKAEYSSRMLTAQDAARAIALYDSVGTPERLRQAAAQN